MNKPENPPAFPQNEGSWGGFDSDKEGMSLRDWFAGQALAGTGHLNYDTIEAMVATAYRIADSMLAERSKP